MPHYGRDDDWGHDDDRRWDEDEERGGSMREPIERSRQRSFQRTHDEGRFRSAGRRDLRGYDQRGYSGEQQSRHRGSGAFGQRYGRPDFPESYEGARERAWSGGSVHGGYGNYGGSSYDRSESIGRDL